MAGGRWQWQVAGGRWWVAGRIWLKCCDLRALSHLAKNVATFYFARHFFLKMKSGSRL